MKNHIVRRNSEKQSSKNTARPAVDGENGMSIASPDYGIGFVDQPPTQFTDAAGQRALLFQADDEESSRSSRHAKAAPFVEALRMKVVSAPSQSQIEQPPATNDTGLPGGLKSGIESLSGISLEAVNVHYNSSEPAQLNALAYTHGRDIYIAPGQERHLPHEAWHVVQQAQGRVRPTMQMKDEAPVNDEADLEHEADVMGTRALAGRSRLDRERPRDQRQVPEPIVQRQAIKSAGLELELKGALLTKGEERKDYGTHEKVIDKDDWWIEVDSRNPELVTEPTESRAELLGWLKLGQAVLNDIQLYAEKSQAVNALDDDDTSPQARALMDELAAVAGRLNLPDHVNADLNAGSEYLAKPQISFGIKKGELHSFAQSVVGSKIRFTEGYNKTKAVDQDRYIKYENAEWPRVNIEVQKIYTSSPMWQNEKGKAFVEALSTASAEAKGLSLMTVITILFALRKQDPNDVWQYYKARFSAMPRVPLSEMYDVLEETDQEKYRALIKLWYDAVKLHNEGKEETSEGYQPTKIYRAQKDKTITVEQELSSIISPEKRRKKTLKDKTKQVDLISTDAMASTENVGASVGALDLPKGFAGIYEIRSMPYIKIQNYQTVENITQRPSLLTAAWRKGDFTKRAEGSRLSS